MGNASGLGVLSPREDVHRRAAGGFTRPGVVIALALLAAVTVLVVVSYRADVVGIQLGNAAGGLLAVQDRMERHFQAFRTYGAAGTVPAPCQVDEASRRFGDFLVSCASPPGASGYLLQAEGLGTVAGFVFTLDQSGRQATVKARAGWPTCPSRWIMVKGEAC